MEKAELLESLRTLAEAVEISQKVEELDAGEAVKNILDNTDCSCSYEAVRKIVTAVTSYSESTKMSFAKCLKEDGWAEGSQCSGAVLDLKVTGLGVPMGRVAQGLYEGLNVEQKELLLELVSELIPLLLNDEDLHFDGLNGIVDESTLQEWADENGWKHPDKDSISDFTEGMSKGEVNEFVVEYIQDNL